MENISLPRYTREELYEILQIKKRKLDSHTQELSLLMKTAYSLQSYNAIKSILTCIQETVRDLEQLYRKINRTTGDYNCCETDWLIMELGHFYCKKHKVTIRPGLNIIDRHPDCNMRRTENLDKLKRIQLTESKKLPLKPSLLNESQGE